MAPHESLWTPVIKMTEQCNYCLKYFHQDIGGICSQCYQVMSRLLYDQPVEEVSGISLDVPEPSEECEEE